MCKTGYHWCPTNPDGYDESFRTEKNASDLRCVFCRLQFAADELPMRGKSAGEVFFGRHAVIRIFLL